MTDPTFSERLKLLRALSKIANGEVLAFYSPCLSELRAAGWIMPTGHISTNGIASLAMGPTGPIDVLTLAIACGMEVMRDGEDVRIGHAELDYVTGAWATWEGMSQIAEWAMRYLVKQGPRVPWAFYLFPEEEKVFLASMAKAGQKAAGPHEQGVLLYGDRSIATIHGVAVLRAHPAATKTPELDTRMGCVERVAQGRAVLPTGPEAERAVEAVVSMRQMVSAREDETLAEAVYRWSERRVGSDAPLTHIATELERRAKMVGRADAEVAHLAAAADSLRKVLAGPAPTTKAGAGGAIDPTSYPAIFPSLVRDVGNMTEAELREEVAQHRQLLNAIQGLWRRVGIQDSDTFVTAMGRVIQQNTDLATDTYQTRMMRVRRSEAVLANEVCARFNDRISAGDVVNANHLGVAAAILRAVASGKKPEVRIPWRRSVGDLVTDLQEHLSDKELRQLRMEISGRVGVDPDWEALHASHDAEIREALRAEEGEATLAAAFRVAGRTAVVGEGGALAKVPPFVALARLVREVFNGNATVWVHEKISYTGAGLATELEHGSAAGFVFADEILKAARTVLLSRGPTSCPIPMHPSIANNVTAILAQAQREKADSLFPLKLLVTLDEALKPSVTGYEHANGSARLTSIGNVVLAYR